MWRSTELEVKTNDSEFFGIYPVIPDSPALKDDRAIELRARCVLAYGFEHHKLTTYINVGKESKTVTVGRSDLMPTSAEELRLLQKPVNTGCIYTASSLSEGWSKQPCRLFLNLELAVDEDMALRFYFAPSIRWLSDREAAKDTIARIFRA